MNRQPLAHLEFNYPVDHQIQRIVRIVYVDLGQQMDTVRIILTASNGESRPWKALLDYLPQLV